MRVDSFCDRLIFSGILFLPSSYSLSLGWVVHPSAMPPAVATPRSSPAELPASWGAFFHSSPSLSHPVEGPTPNFQLFYGSMSLLGRKLKSILHCLLQVINWSVTKPKECILSLMCGWLPLTLIKLLRIKEPAGIHNRMHFDPALQSDSYPQGINKHFKCNFYNSFLKSRAITEYIIIVHSGPSEWMMSAIRINSAAPRRLQAWYVCR